MIKLRTKQHFQLTQKESLRNSTIHNRKLEIDINIRAMAITTILMKTMQS
jgi:hypothetical protein